MSLVVFGEIIFQEILTNQMFAWDFCVVQQAIFHHHRDYKQVNFYKKLRPYIVGWSMRDR